mmetsp:Transcript_80678/g.184889  ORF Transcript_80678/g.184889 Transcript_80678/m.184889 type:complete len:227 (+) Transcript_80678:2-682(+)
MGRVTSTGRMAPLRRATLVRTATPSVSPTRSPMAIKTSATARAAGTGTRKPTRASVTASQTGTPDLPSVLTSTGRVTGEGRACTARTGTPRGRSTAKAIPIPKERRTVLPRGTGTRRTVVALRVSTVVQTGTGLRTASAMVRTPRVTARETRDQQGTSPTAARRAMAMVRTPRATERETRDRQGTNPTAARRAKGMPRASSPLGRTSRSRGTLFGLANPISTLLPC